MENLTDFIKQEKEKRVQETPTANPKNSLMELKNALDGFGTPISNPILENAKKVDTMVESKQNPSFVKPKIPNTQTFDEKEDQFNRDLLIKSREFVNKVAIQTPQNHIVEEKAYHPPKVEPDYYNHIPQQKINNNGGFNNNDALKVLKDTITDLYVTEKIESVIKEYLQTDEGKKLLKSIVIGLFKKK